MTFYEYFIVLVSAVVITMYIPDMVREVKREIQWRKISKGN